LCVSLFFISIDVNVQSRGVITTKEKTTIITIPVYGKIQSIRIAENLYVTKGDTLMVIDPTEVQQNMALATDQIETLTSFINDLQKLTCLSKLQLLLSISTVTPKYKQELQKYVSDLQFQKSEIDILNKEYVRQKQLYENKVIALADYEQATYKYESASLKYTQLQTSQLAAWQSELADDKSQLVTLNKSRIDQGKELQKYFIVASTSGHIQNLSGVERGSIVFPNQEVATLSPNAELIAETYVSTSDIGMINPHQTVKLRIDTYDANTWGFVQGNVLGIANDITTSNNQSQGFRVICALNSKTLQYQNKRVTVKKGMSFTANFVLMKRTLAQLLYDKVSDWLNPNINKNS